VTRSAWERSDRLRLLCAFASFVAWSAAYPTDARAEAALVPAADGSVGAWLVSGPLPAGTRITDIPLPTTALTSGGPKLRLAWTLEDAGKAALDLRKKAANRARVALTAVLHADAAVDLWLLLSVDGKAALAVDGATLWERAVAHARGASWDPVALHLGPGDHRVLLVLDRHAPLWNVEARLLAQPDLEPPPNVTWRFPGTSDKDAERLAAHLLRVTPSAGLSFRGFAPHVTFDFPRGSPTTPVHAALTRSSSGVAGTVLDVTLATSGGVFRGQDVVLPSPPVAPAFDELRVRIGGDETRFRLALDTRAPPLVVRAAALVARLDARAPGLQTMDAAIAAASLEDALASLPALVDHGDPATTAALGRLETLVTTLEAGRDPLRQPGVLPLARRSRLDGDPDAFRLHVPRGYDPASAKKYPLVVVLHGYGGNPERVMNAFLGTESLAPHPGVDGFVLAPHAHGDAFYRGPGETEVMETLDWVLSKYPIDVDRVSITGISMGGTGASHFAFRFADRFAAAGALAGYHSYFVRRDVRGRPLRPWEWTELARVSPASFAENGFGHFLFLAQGTKDLPLVHTTALAARYKELGYPLKETYPDTGHDVYRVAWQGGSLFPVLARHTRDKTPDRVVLKTDSLRFGTRAFVRVTALSSTELPGTISARTSSGAAGTTISVATRNVEAFELGRPSARVALPGAPDGALRLDVDGQAFDFPAGARFTAYREGTTWKAGTLAESAVTKKPGVEGPIRDAFIGPMTFVYGTMDPRETRVAREVAEHFKNRWSGDTRFPVVADVKMASTKGQNLFLVGSKSSNALVRDLDARLPFGIDGAGVRLGDKRLLGDGELGLAAVFPNPDDPAHVIVCVEGVSVRGLLRSLSLPGNLPDFIVFDSGLAGAAGEQVLGASRVLAGGHFDRRWNLPASVGDFPHPPNVPPQGRPGAGLREFAWERRSLVASETAPPE
jgi:predicted esterase